MLENFDFGTLMHDSDDGLRFANEVLKMIRNIRDIFGKAEGTGTTVEGEDGGGEEPAVTPVAEEPPAATPHEGDGPADTEDSERLSGIEKRLDILEQGLGDLAHAVDTLGKASIKNSESVSTLTGITKTLFGHMQQVDAELKKLH